MPYDERCPLCRRLRAWLSGQATLAPIEYVAADSPEARRRFPELDHRRTTEVLTMVRADGAVYEGERAWLVAAWLLPKWQAAAEHLFSTVRLALVRFGVRLVDAVRPHLRDRPIPWPVPYDSYGSRCDRCRIVAPPPTAQPVRRSHPRRASESAASPGPLPPAGTGEAAMTALDASPAAGPVTAGAVTARTKGTQTRAAIIDVALRLFRERGYEATTMRAIASEVGVSLGNAYYYSASKEELILSPFSAASALARERSIALWRDVVDGSDSKVAKGLAAELPELLWLYFIGHVLFWVHDPSEDNIRTRRLAERTAPLLMRAIALARVPVIKGTIEDLIGLGGELKSL